MAPETLLTEAELQIGHVRAPVMIAWQRRIGAQLTPQRIGGIAPLVLLWRHVGSFAEAPVPMRVLAVTIADLRSSLAGAARQTADPKHPLAGLGRVGGPDDRRHAGATAFRFLGGRL